MYSIMHDSTQRIYNEIAIGQPTPNGDLPACYLHETRSYSCVDAIQLHHLWARHMHYLFQVCACIILILSTSVYLKVDHWVYAVRIRLGFFEFSCSSILPFSILLADGFANRLDFGLALKEVLVILPQVELLKGFVVTIASFWFLRPCPIVAHIPFHRIDLRLQIKVLRWKLKSKFLNSMPWDNWTFIKASYTYI